MTTKRQKGNEGLTMGDALKQTGAVMTVNGWQVRFNQRTEQFELWLKDSMFWSGPDEADAAQKFVDQTGPVDFAHA
jgi:shikimate 5-dehydrogenase